MYNIPAHFFPTLKRRNLTSSYLIALRVFSYYAWSANYRSTSTDSGEFHITEGAD